jgi:hypothetical protein
MRPWLGLVFLPLLSACTGFSLGENDPNSNLGTALGGGEIAVDPRTENTFVLLDATDDQTGELTSRKLFAVAPDEGGPSLVSDLTGRDDPRMLFVEPGIMLMSEANGGERLDLLDQNDFHLKKSVEVPGSYWGTRLSASRRWVGVADNDDPHFPIHVIDSKDLGDHAIPHGGDNLEAMFGNASERLFAIVFYDSTHEARILSWDMHVLETAKFLGIDPDGVWSGADLDITVPDVVSDFDFSFTWVGVSPDDAHVVFPVRKWTGKDPLENAPADEYELLVVDTADGGLRTVPSAKGPVGFTPDGSTIVSYGREDASGDQKLLLVDAETLEVDEQEVSVDGGLSYFVSREGNFVVVASNWGGQQLSLYDVDNQKETKMAGKGIGLTEFVSRIGHDELWAIDSEALYRVDMAAAVVEDVSLPFSPSHINILPKRDRLVLGATDPRYLQFFDPSTRTVTRTVDLAGE